METNLSTRVTRKLVGVVAAIVVSSAWVSAKAAVTEIQCLPVSDVVAKGRAIAEKACAHCHGIDGHSGETAGTNLLITPFLAGQRYHYLVRALEGYRKGRKWDEDPDSVIFSQGMRVHDFMGVAASEITEGDIKAVSAWYHCQGQ